MQVRSFSDIGFSTALRTSSNIVSCGKKRPQYIYIYIHNVITYIYIILFSCYGQIHIYIYRYICTVLIFLLMRPCIQLLSGAEEVAAVMDAEAAAADAEAAEQLEVEHMDDDAMFHEEEHAEAGSGEDMDPDLHSSWMFLQNSDSEDEDAEGAARHLPGIRVKCFRDRPEFVQLEAEGLAERPEGCTVGVHPAGRQWRAYTQDSTYFGRSWGANRTPRQALLRVFQLMLEAYCAQHKHDRLARRQLERVTNARNAEPPHAD